MTPIQCGSSLAEAEHSYRQLVAAANRASEWVRLLGWLLDVRNERGRHVRAREDLQ